MSDDAEFLIVGQGLAGTALAWELLRRGRDVAVIDAEESVTSSRIAAGLVAPITGQRLALSWRIDETLPAARAFYDFVAAELGRHFFHPRTILRFFRDVEERDRWRRKRNDPNFLRFVDHECPEAGEFGAVGITGGGNLDCAGYLDASRSAFQRRGVYRRLQFDPRNPRQVRARRIIHCQGFAAAAHPDFSWVPWKAAKGELLTVRIPSLAHESRVLSSGQWLVPLGGGNFRAGSTYEWRQLDSVPTPGGRAVLEAGVRRLAGPSFEVIDHAAAVRPIINESKALIGVHPADEHLAFFNGLGSKGALHAPFFAGSLAAHLVDGAPLDEACDLRRNL